MSQNLHDDISLFFRQFALSHLSANATNTPDSQDIKMMMVNHCEEIYPAFAKTDVFRHHYQQEGHERMVEEYKRCFTLLLTGRLP